MSYSPDSDTNNESSKLSKEDVLKLLNMAYELKKALRVGDSFKVDRILKEVHLLYLLLEYLIANMGNPGIDKEIIAFLLEYLGKQKDKSQEEEKEEEMDKEEFEKMMRWVIYETYKAMTPRQIAGETPIENFIKNVKLVGIEEAVKQEGNEFIKAEAIKELSHIEIHQKSFAEIVKQSGKSNDQGLSH